MLRSTRDIGQTFSLKRRLKHILDRYKAGIKLTEEEHNLLFPQSSNTSESTEVSDLQKNTAPFSIGKGSIHSTKATSSSATETEDLTVTFKSIGTSILDQFSKLKSTQSRKIKSMQTEELEAHITENKCSNKWYDYYSNSDENGRNTSGSNCL